MIDRGWYLAGVGDVAHYYMTAARALCGAAVAMAARWTVAEHVGKVGLCEACKGYVRGEAAHG